MIKSCLTCGGLYTTENGEYFSGMACSCITPDRGDYAELQPTPTTCDHEFVNTPNTSGYNFCVPYCKKCGKTLTDFPKSFSTHGVQPPQPNDKEQPNE